LENKQPLHTQKEVQRRHKDFEKVAKDGRFTFLGVDLTKVKTIGKEGLESSSNSPIELKVSRPWKTHKEQQ
jgi:hypothetical protein